MYELWSGKGVSLGLQLLRICFLSCNPQFGSSKIPFCISYLDSSLEFFFFFFIGVLLTKRRRNCTTLGRQFGKIYPKARVGTSHLPSCTQDPAKNPNPGMHSIRSVGPRCRETGSAAAQRTDRGLGGSARTDSRASLGWCPLSFFSFLLLGTCSSLLAGALKTSSHPRSL